jgi:hypothetical protein
MSWEELNVIDVTSAFVGVTTPVPDLINKITELGWEVDNIGFSKNQYETSASNEHGGKLKATGNTENTALGNLLSMIQRQHSMRLPLNARAAKWSDPFVDLQEAIAHEYADAKTYDKKAAAAWMELAEDCRRRVEIIQEEIKIEITSDPIPYKSFSEMADDIMKKRHFLVSKANSSHPIWSINQVVDFRIAHDILGHAASGGDWSWFGINRAFQAHAPLLTYTAQKALFTEVLGQGAFNSYYGSYNTQKIAFLDIFDNPEDGKDPYHHPVHPSQTIVPGELAKIPNDVNFEKEGSFEDLLDPNDGFETGILPLENNAFSWHRIKNDKGEMIDPLNSRELGNVVNGIRSDWHQLDEASQEQAVANAFRNIFLKPGKHERAHGQHYQAINHLPGSVDNPSRYWDALTHARDSHNIARGYMLANKELDPFLMPLKRQIKTLNNDLTDHQVNQLADDHLLNMRVEEELAAKDKLGDDASSDDIHRETTKRLLKRLKKITNAKVNQDHDFGNERMFFEAKHPDSSIYPSPLAHHIEPISDISKNIKEITQAALEDIENGGKGHHFRVSLMSQYLTDENLQDIDQVWFNLAPDTSQLGAITPDILKALGYKKDDFGVRDYFKAERELQGARDASGYGHLPLGQFSKALRNAMRYSPGHHPTKDHLHLLMPTPHTEIEWHNRQPKAEKPKVPGWFNDTKKIRKQIGQNWDRLEGVQHPKDAIPFQKKADAAFSTFMPFFTHPDNKQRINGKPNQSLMQHIIESMMLNDNQQLSTPEVWALDPEVGKEVMPSDSIN